MRSKINFYMGMRSPRYSSCLYYNDLMIEKNYMDTEAISYHIWCFGKNSEMLLERDYKNIKLKNLEKEILGSCMVIIRTLSGNKAEMIKQLAEISKDNYCYAPIIFLDNSDILFFPKLRFHDTYLIKSILEEQLKSRNYQILYGGSSLSLI